MKNYYEILQVNPKASSEIIDKAYHTLVKKYHPDMQESEIEKLRSEQILKDLNEAYYVLSDVFLREQYDKELNEQIIKEQIQQNNMRQNNNNQYNYEQTVKKEQKARRIKNQRNTQKNDYEVGTLSGIFAILDRLFQDKPDISKIKKVKKKDVFAFLIAVLIVVVLCVILWFIPFTNVFIRELLFMK